jgi:hypothetical protein
MTASAQRIRYGKIKSYLTHDRSRCRTTPSDEARAFRNTSWFASGQRADRLSPDMPSAVPSAMVRLYLGGSRSSRGGGRLPCVQGAGELHRFRRGHDGTAVRGEHGERLLNTRFSSRLRSSGQSKASPSVAAPRLCTGLDKQRYALLDVGREVWGAPRGDSCHHPPAHAGDPIAAPRRRGCRGEPAVRQLPRGRERAAGPRRRCPRWRRAGEGGAARIGGVSEMRSTDYRGQSSASRACSLRSSPSATLDPAARPRAPCN